MAYRIEGLDRRRFAGLAALDAAALAAIGAERVVADADYGYPCRVSLVDARKGEALWLLNYRHHDVHGPYAAAHAIYVREAALGEEAGLPFVDRAPPVFAGRALSLRGYDAQGRMRGARLALPEQMGPEAGGDHADAAIRALFADCAIAYIHVHNAAPGCFAATVVRDGEPA